MKTTSVYDATLRRLMKFVDCWKQHEEFMGFADDKKFISLSGRWTTLAELRSMPRCAILNAIGYELSKGVSRDVVSASLCVAATKTGISLLNGDQTLAEVVAALE